MPYAFSAILGAMKSVMVMALLAVIAPPAQLAQAAQIQVRATVMEVATGDTPQSAKVDCQPGELAVGGGFTLRSPELRVTASYPAGSSWVVEAVNPGKLPLALELSAACLSGGESVVVSSTAGRVNCPPGAVVAGGGFQSRNGSVVNSYPSLGDSWFADGPAVTQVFAACIRGVQRGRTVTATVNMMAGTPACTPDFSAVLACSWPRTGSQQLSCPAGEVLTMGGQLLVTGTMPVGAITSSNTDGRSWTFRLTGSNRDSAALSVDVAVLCLRLTAPSAAAVPPGRVNLGWPLLGGAGLLILLLLAAVIIQGGRKRATANSPQLEAVLTGQRTSLRYSAFREVP